MSDLAPQIVEIETILVDPPLIIEVIDDEPDSIVEVVTETTEIIEVVEQGRPGPPGPVGKPFEYMMPVAQTTATFEHDLGFDPTAVQVFVDGQLCSEYTVTFPVPDHVVRVGFDVSVKAFIRII